jgi:hypothetical protein
MYRIFTNVKTSKKNGGRAGHQDLPARHSGIRERGGKLQPPRRTRA